MLDTPLFVVAVLAANVVLAEVLAQKTCLRHLGSALLVILTTAICANLGLIPTYGGSVVYDGIFGYVAPLGIFWLLLGCNLRQLERAGGPMILLFVLGALGTTVGVLTACWTIRAVGGAAAFGEHFAGIGGMFVGTYIGGSANFNAIAISEKVNENGVLFAGANLVDSGMTTVWMAVCVLVPRLLAPVWKSAGPAKQLLAGPELGAAELDVERVGPVDLARLLVLGGLAVACSEWISATIEDATAAARGGDGLALPSMLFLTVIALGLAQSRRIQALRGARLSGMLAVLFFLAVIGALCDVRALAASGELGSWLVVLVTIAVVLHGLILFGGARLLRLDPAMAAVASQANIGGGTSALALARSLGRHDLVLPSILVGSLGTALGNFLGFLTVGLLGGGAG